MQRYLRSTGRLSIRSRSSEATCALWAPCTAAAGVSPGEGSGRTPCSPGPPTSCPQAVLRRRRVLTPRLRDSRSDAERCPEEDQACDAMPRGGSWISISRSNSGSLFKRKRAMCVSVGSRFQAQRDSWPPTGACPIDQPSSTTRVLVDIENLDSLPRSRAAWAAGVTISASATGDHTARPPCLSRAAPH